MLDDEDIKILNSFIPRDTQMVFQKLGRLRGHGHYFDGTPLCQASDGDVDRFIQEQYDKRFLVEISYNWHSEWSYIQGQLMRGKPVLYNDRFINPVKLDLSNYLRKKEGK